MDDLRVVTDSLLWSGALLAAAALVVVAVERRRESTVADGWLAALLAAFAVSSLPIASLGFDIDSEANSYAWRVVPACVLALPGLVSRAVSALCRCRTRLHLATDALSCALVLATLLAPRFPGARSDDLPWWYQAMIAGFLLQLLLALLASRAAIARATRGQPRVIRLRGATMLAALLGFAVSYGPWIVAPTPSMSAITSFTLLASGVLFVLAIRSPRAVAWLLARPDDALDDVLDRIVLDADVRPRLPRLLQRAAEVHGLQGIAVLDAEGRVVELVGSSSVEAAASGATRELRVAAQAGGSTVVAWSSALSPPLRSRDRTRLALLATLVRMSIERDAVAADARAAAASLLEANELKDRFVALVSHELRTPLTSIIGLARTSHERWDELEPARIHEFQQVIAQQGERLAQIVEHLLLVSSIEAGAVRASDAPLDLLAVIVDATADAGLAASISIDVPHELERIVADERLLREIIVNFLSNADKYAAPPFAIRVRRSGDELEVVVRDNGGGVAPAVRERMFERFTRDPASTSAGSGLGLAIASDLATAMQGRVGHQDAAGGGSEFWLRIPLNVAG